MFGSFRFLALPPHFPLTPGMRAHYQFNGCQPVSSADKLICGFQFESDVKGGQGATPAIRLITRLGTLCPCRAPVPPEVSAYRSVTVRVLGSSSRLHSHCFHAAAHHITLFLMILSVACAMACHPVPRFRWHG